MMVVIPTFDSLLLSASHVAGHGDYYCSCPAPGAEVDDLQRLDSWTATANPPPVVVAAAAPEHDDRLPPQSLPQ